MEARAVLEAAVAAGNHSPVTQLNLALAEERCGDADAARRRIEKVAAEVPGWDEPLLRLAESLRWSGEWPAAEQAYRRTLELNPLRYEALLALGAGLVARGRAAEALLFLVQACECEPQSFEAWHALGLAQLAVGNAVPAEAALARACQAAPDRLDVAQQRAEAAIAAGAAEAELARLEAQACTRPLDPFPRRVQAHLLALLGRMTDALDMLEAAAAIAPADAGCAAALGHALAGMERTSEAEAALRRALALDPSSQQTRADLATVLIRHLHFPEAETLLRGLIEEIGPQGLLLSNLATALVGQGRQEEAITAARRATEVAPDAIQPWRTLTAVLPYSASAEDHAAAARACARRYPRGSRVSLFRKPDPDRPLRVGLLSNALRTHPVGWLTLAAWEALDRAAFDLVCLGPRSLSDVFAHRFAARASEWHDLAGYDDESAAALCRTLEIDVLVDLGGHGEAGRLGVLARRAAPVQVKWVGSQIGTTGLPETDWFVTDRWETPPECADLYGERLLILPDGYVCYGPPSSAPDVSPLPALTNGSVTFGCFNNLAKITPEVIQSWAAILASVPGSKLVCKAPQFDQASVVESVKARLAAAGIDRRRVTLRGASDHRTHLTAYADVDLALDPFPYSGGLSTCEALWMGVPTVTLPGRSFASRHTLSHQENAGLSGWAAGSREQYVALAVARASELDELAALRAGLRAQVAASPLCDASRFGRSLGGALRNAWQAWCTDRQDC